MNFCMVPDNGMINGTNYSGLLPFPVIVYYVSAQAAFTSNLFGQSEDILYAISSTVVLVIYLRLFCAMRKIFRKNQTTRNQQQQQQQAKASFWRDIRLLGYGIIIVILQILCGTFSVLLSSYGMIWYRPLEIAINFNSYIHPYFLLLLSSPLRNRCLTVIGIHQQSQRGTQIALSPAAVSRNLANSPAPISFIQERVE